jgi:hypothetical protein
VRHTGETLVTDIHIFVNCPGIVEKNKTTSYPCKLKSKVSDCVAYLFDDYHKWYGLKKLKHLHSDQEASMTSTKTQKWLKKDRIMFTSFFKDTSELNGLAKVVDKWLGHQTMAIMHHAGR